MCNSVKVTPTCVLFAHFSCSFRTLRPGGLSNGVKGRRAERPFGLMTQQPESGGANRARGFEHSVWPSGLKSGLTSGGVCVCGTLDWSVSASCSNYIA